MQQTGRTYIAIDLKSFYASVECMERGLDPLTTNLVVADASRTEKTICLAVSPSLKAHGISGRARLFEVVERVKEVNAERRRKAGCLSEKSFNANELAADPSREVDYLIAPPRMAKYIQVSTQIYNVYLKYIAPEDIHVYSIDEVMMDVTNYLQTYRMTARELAKVMISDVLHTTGITATAGIGSNLYLCKVAMDIMAKHVQPDKDGVRIAALDEMSYREQLWDHRPLTDFWRVGRGYAKKLEAIGIYTMGDVARCSIGKPNEYYNEELLYRMFGINAELLIDHAWGWEPCRMQDIKAYRPETNSVCSGQVLQCPYSFEKARLVVREMAEAEYYELKEKLPELEKEIKILLLPKDEEDEKNAILEVRAGTGGDEAALFAAVLFEMYQRYAQKQGWRFEILDADENGLGGYKEASAKITGKDVFSKLKFESGAHRVQRVPVTESQGRVHTSAATVAVLPEIEEVDMYINPADLKIDVYRASGAGGQHVNRTESAVRITHIPTGIVVQCQDDRSQFKNKEKAMNHLRAKLYDQQKTAIDAEYSERRKLQVGSGDRSERIRTYNYPQGRVTDHRINLTLYKLDDIVSGDALGEIIDALIAEDQARRLSELE